MITKGETVVSSHPVNEIMENGIKRVVGSHHMVLTMLSLLEKSNQVACKVQVYTMLINDYELVSWKIGFFSSKFEFCY